MKLHSHEELEAEAWSSVFSYSKQDCIKAINRFRDSMNPCLLLLSACK